VHEQRQQTLAEVAVALLQPLVAGRADPAASPGGGGRLWSKGWR